MNDHSVHEKKNAVSLKRPPPRLSLINLQKETKPSHPKSSRLRRENRKVDILKAQLKKAQIASSIVTPTLEFKTIQHRITKTQKNKSSVYLKKHILLVFSKVLR